ncbi:cupin domain-containing protein [Paractinoplanes globisporus]|uniref:Cupin domain-containing protein n=1 Tax=Paractinoplanes globisporus TaxID=113565 RepID=A0ABW6WCI4_9ACTN|nr:cupin domain-containing protein [Actinoplanes globisporus]
MTDGLLLGPGDGTPIQAMTLKAGADRAGAFSVFEAEVAPGFDVGAHWHERAEEMFYVLDGELDLLAFAPADRSGDDWRGWRSHSGQAVFRGGPGSFMFVPAGCPHAFFNPHDTAARMLFAVAPSGHEVYLRELADLLSSGPPDPAAVEALRLRHDIHQLTPLRNRA